MLKNYVGEIAGLGAALSWAVASILFRRLGSAIPPFALNLYKGIAAVVMLVIALTLRSELWSGVGAQALVLLAVSGVVGIGIGDTAFFAALNRMGERRTVLMAETLAPPIATIMAFMVLAEILSAAKFLGIAITAAGVAWVIVEQTPKMTVDASQLKSGIGYGLLAAFCQAAGAVLSRAALTQSEIGPLSSALIRIVGGLVFLLVWMPSAGHAFVPEAVRRAKTWRLLLLATFLGTFLGLILQQLSLQNTQAGVAQTLLATSALFILPLVVLRGETISWRAAFGAAVGAGGIALIFLTK